MERKKIAIYVEGVTEQVLLNTFLSKWWGYTNLYIKNFKLDGDRLNSCASDIQDSSFGDLNTADIFLIINVQGYGSIPAGINSRLKRHREEGFLVLGLRDLNEDDYRKHSSLDDFKKSYLARLRQQLQLKKNPEPIPDVFFSVMEVEAWKLAFLDAIVSWSEKNVVTLNQILKFNIETHSLEEIPNPASAIKRINPRDTDSKSASENKKFCSQITKQAIQQVYDSKRVPSFNIFWDYICYENHGPNLDQNRSTDSI